MTSHRNMWSRRAFLLAAALTAAGCTDHRLTGHVRIGGGDPGGLYLAVANVLARRLTAHYPKVTIDVVATEGTVDNLARLRSAEVDMAFAQADVAERDQDTTSSAPLAIARVYENYLQIVVRDGTAIRQLDDLRGRRVCLGAPRSGGAVTADVLFEASGIRDQVSVVRLRLKDALASLTDGTVDAVVWSGGVPTPAISQLHATLPLRTLDLGQYAAPMAHTRYPYQMRQMPAGEYVQAGLRSIGVPDLLLCREGLATDLVASVVRVIVTDAADLLPPPFRGLEYLTPESMIQTGLVPPHPGAITAYRTLHG